MLKQYKQLLQTTEIKQGVAIIGATKFTPAQIKPQSFESRRNSFFFLPGVDASHVYVRAWALGCFHSHMSTQTFWNGADRVGGLLRGDKDYPFSGVTNSGRVWRKVPESDARSVPYDVSPSCPSSWVLSLGCLVACVGFLLLAIVVWWAAV